MTVPKDIADIYIMYCKATYTISLQEFSRTLALMAYASRVDQQNDGTLEASFSTRHNGSYRRSNVPL